MRTVLHAQMSFGEEDISKIKLDPKSRDDIPQLLAGLKCIHVNRELRKAVFGILAEVLPTRAKDKGKASKSKGRPGMEQWKILVLATLRLALGTDYDRIHELANQHQTLRKMMGHLPEDNTQYTLQTIKNNIGLFTEDHLNRISNEVVKHGHSLLGKSDDSIGGRCDSFVVKTNVHYPTDINLAFDSVRKMIEECAKLSDECDDTKWRQSDYNISKYKKQYRKIQNLKHSTSKKDKKRELKEEEIKMAYTEYIDLGKIFIARAQATRLFLSTNFAHILLYFGALDTYIMHAERQMDQILRRAIQGEQIPHDEKVFSIFQPHTEWISKGKAGVPVELGLRVCILEDRNGFILHHKVMEQETDDKVAISMVKDAKDKFNNLIACSFDKGFHSPNNHVELNELLDLSALPKKGRLSLADKQKEESPEFIKARREHSAVESAINALGVHGLDMCPDHGIDGFKKYVALAMVARNILRLGAIVRTLESKKKRGPYKKAA